MPRKALLIPGHRGREIWPQGFRQRLAHTTYGDGGHEVAVWRAQAALHAIVHAEQRCVESVHSSRVGKVDGQRATRLSFDLVTTTVDDMRRERRVRGGEAREIVTAPVPVANMQRAPTGFLPPSSAASSASSPGLSSTTSPVILPAALPDALPAALPAALLTAPSSAIRRQHLRLTTARAPADPMPDGRDSRTNRAPFGALGPRQRRRLRSQRVAMAFGEAQLGHLLEAVVGWVGRLACHCAATLAAFSLPLQQWSWSARGGSACKEVALTAG